MNWLLGEKNARGTIHHYPPSCPFHTNQHEDYQGVAGRGGGGGGGPQGLRGCSIRPLKRAKDGDDEWETRL